MGSPKRTTATTTSQGATSAASSGGQSQYGISQTLGPAAQALEANLNRARGLSEGNYAVGPSALQSQAFGAAPGLFGRGMTGLNTLEGLATGGTQNQALEDSLRSQLQLGEGRYLNNVLGTSGGLTNSGAREELARLQNDFLADRLSNEYRFNVGSQMGAAQAMPSYISGMLGPLASLGGTQRGIASDQALGPVQAHGILGDALRLGGARYGTGTTGGSDFSRQSEGTTSTVGTQPGETKPSFLGQILGLAGTLGGAALGGPAGGMLGSSFGNFFRPQPAALPMSAMLPTANPHWFSMGGT